MLGLTDPIILERIAILANFVAAFLLAPELLGVRNLQRLETAATALGGMTDRLNGQIVDLAEKIEKNSLVKQRFGFLRSVTLLVIFATIYIRSQSSALHMLTIALFVVAAIPLIEFLRQSVLYPFSPFQGVYLLIVFVPFCILLIPISAVYLMLVVGMGWAGMIGILSLVLVSLFLQHEESTGIGSLRAFPEVGMRMACFLTLFGPLLAVAVTYIGLFYAPASLINGIRNAVVFSQGRAKGLLIGMGVLFFVIGTVAQFGSTLFESS